MAVHRCHYTVHAVGKSTNNLSARTSTCSRKTPEGYIKFRNYSRAANLAAAKKLGSQHVMIFGFEDSDVIQGEQGFQACVQAA
jgi:hypothetical protein